MLDRLPVGAVPLAGSSVVGHARKLADTPQAQGAKSSRNRRHICCTSVPLQAAAATYCQYVARRLGPIVLLPVLVLYRISTTVSGS